MSTAARWSLRLPRASTRLVESRAGTRNAIRRVEQRRWVQQPPQSQRPWTSRSQRDIERESVIQRPEQGGVKRTQQDHGEPQEQQQQAGRNTQLATTLAQSSNPDLITPVHIPSDPHGIIPSNHPALSLLGNSSLVIQRQLEMMNVMLGFEQANRYIIMDGHGTTLGYIAEQDHGLGSAMARQMFRTHRSFTTHIFDREEREVLRIHRPFAYINSRIRIYDPVPEGGYVEERGMEESTALQGTSASSAMNTGAVARTSPLKLEEMRIIGEAQQQWAPLRRKYNLFTYRPLEPSTDNSNAKPRIESGEHPTTDTVALTESKTPDRAIEAGMSQFAHVNEPFLSWDFTLRSEDNTTIGSVNRNFSGFAREIFTDTGVYALRMDSAAQTSTLESPDGKEELGRYEREATAMTLDQRAVMLATAVSIDFDYFSRHSGVGHGGFMPLWWPMGGGGGGAAAEGGAAGAGAGAAGAAGTDAAGVGTAVGVGEGAVGAATGAAGRGVAGAGGAAAESGIAGAGTMAGYEAMQRGVYGSPRSGGAEDASPQAGNNEPFSGASGGQEQAENRPGNDGVWGEDQDPWGGGDGGGGGGAPPPGAGGESGGGGGGGGEGGGGWMDTISDFFGDS